MGTGCDIALLEAFKMLSASAVKQRAGVIFDGSCQVKYNGCCCDRLIVIVTMEKCFRCDPPSGRIPR